MLSRVWKVFVATMAVCASAVSGHGYLAQPAARNVQRNSDYCPQCLNGGGTWTVFSAGLPGRYGVCGDAWNGPKPHERGPFRVAGTYRAGGTLRARVVLTANHRGRWGLKLCPSRTGKQSCFDAHVLKRADGKGPWTQVPANQNSFTVSYRLPRGLKCRQCVLQWTYETGNSCNLSGGSGSITGVSRCTQSTNWERFWNCADIAIV